MITYNIKKLKSGDIVTAVTIEYSYEGDFDINDVMGWVSRLLKIGLDDDYSMDMQLHKYKIEAVTCFNFVLHDRYDNYIPKIFHEGVREMLEDREDYKLLIELGRKGLL